MTACRKPIAAFVQSSLAAAMLEFCLVWSLPMVGGSICQAAEPIEPPAGVEAAMASDQAAEGPLLGSAEANTPARLDDTATSASRPLSPRPLFCCRPAPSAKTDVDSDRQVHPTLAALADAVRPRRTTKPRAPRPSAMSLPSARAPESFENQGSPVEAYSEPEPLRHESPETHEPIATPAAEMAPRVIANPWAQRVAAKASIEPNSLPAAPAAQTPRPVAEKKQAVERPAAPAAPPAAEQPAWRPSEARPVRQARYHRGEPQRAASASLAPVAERAAAPAEHVENSAAENPLREGEAVRVSRGGDWSNATANPLR